MLKCVPILVASLVFSCTSAYADTLPNNNGEIVTNNVLQEGTTPINNNKRLSSAEDSADNFLGALDNVFSDVGDPLASDTASNVSASLSPLAQKVIAILIGSIPSIYLILTALEFFAIMFKPLRFVFNDGKSGGGEGMGGSSKSSGYLAASEDYLAVIGASSSGGGMTGEPSGNSKGSAGTSGLLTKYFKMRFKTIIIALIVVCLLFTPFGFNLVMTIVELIMSLFKSLFGFLQGRG